MIPKPFWRMRPGNARREAKAIFTKYYDFVDWARKRGIVVDADIDIVDDRIVLSKNGQSVTLHRDFGPGYLRGVLRQLNPRKESNENLTC